MYGEQQGEYAFLYRGLKKAAAKRIQMLTHAESVYARPNRWLNCIQAGAYCSYRITTHLSYGQKSPKVMREKKQLKLERRNNS